MLVSLSGSRINDWECMPGMQIATPSVTHYENKYAGILHFPSDLTVAEIDLSLQP